MKIWTAHISFSPQYAYNAEVVNHRGQRGRVTRVAWHETVGCGVRDGKKCHDLLKAGHPAANPEWCHCMFEHCDHANYFGNFAGD